MRIRSRVLASLRSGALPTLVALAGGCSSTTVGYGPDGTQDTSAGGGDVTGIWNANTTSASGEGNGTGSIVVSSTGFTISAGTEVLSYTTANDSMSALWQDEAGTQLIQVSNSYLTGNVMGGVIPLDFGGQWAFVNETAVTLALTPGSLQLQGEADGIPPTLPRPTPGLRYVGNKTSTTSSIFGDLSGTWILSSTGSSSGSGTCTVTFSGSSFTSSCTNTGSMLEGTSQITFSSDLQSASGTTSSGFDIAAQR